MSTESGPVESWLRFLGYFGFAVAVAAGVIWWGTTVRDMSLGTIDVVVVSAFIFIVIMYERIIGWE